MNNTKQNPPNPNVATASRGYQYWRSLEEYAQTDEFHDWMHQEFAGGYDPEKLLSVSRRRFMQLAAASLSLAGITLSGCRRWPEQQIAPFGSRPDDRIPGTTQRFATMSERGGVATDLLVTTYDGRPIKIDGNPEHPISRGSSDVFAQASVLELYDPQRANKVTRGAATSADSSWDEFAHFAHDAFGHNGPIAVLSEASASPSHEDMRRRLIEKFPGTTWYTWEPINRDHEIEGARQAFGRPLRAQYDLTESQLIVCFDCDLLSGHPAALKHARQWAEGRASADHGAMNQLYAFESGFSLTGSVADERLPVRSSVIPSLVAALAQKLEVPVQYTGDPIDDEVDHRLDVLARNLLSHPNRSLITVGPSQPAEVHALAWAINNRLGAIGHSVQLTHEPGPPEATQKVDQITQLSERLVRSKVKTLLILGGNPVYDAPADLAFGSALDKLAAHGGHAIHLSVYHNETSIRCHWRLPRAHDLECWGDGRTWDGTVSIQQPLILPLFEGRSPIELLALLTNDVLKTGRDIVKRTFTFGNEHQRSATTIEGLWHRSLRDGFVRNSQFKTVTEFEFVKTQPTPITATAPNGWELAFYPSRQVYDGRYANNGWLQELPEPMAKTVWDNVALVNIQDARDLGLNKNGQKLRITVGDQAIEIPAYLMPGQARGSIGLWLGYGRTQSGHIGQDVGVNTYKIRRSEALHVAAVTAESIEATKLTYELALTQNHYLLDPTGMRGKQDRAGVQGESGHVVREATLHQYSRNPHFANAHDHTGDVPLQLWDPPQPEGGWPKPAHPEAPTAFNQPHAWGMSIDVNACIGCSACIIACQAENNIAVVGREQVLRHREMHWLRTDRYFKTASIREQPTKAFDAQNPQVVHMPVPCQQCENAPCEQVCPVAATVHDTEGLNTMIYNRCIGTRYCSNNCPYKVRRFNYFDFHSIDVRGTGIPGLQANPWLNLPDTQQEASVNEIKRMVFNPEVTIRMRGVMEKCTYCTQRISVGKIAAKNQWIDDQRPEPHVLDGEVTTACQDACPTRAIAFGDLNDPNSQVSQWQAHNRSYGLLTELNTRPRTKYLAKLRNPPTE